MTRETLKAIRSDRGMLMTLAERRVLADRLTAASLGRYVAADPSAPQAERHAAEFTRALERRNPTELYIVCPSTHMPVCMGEFSHRCGEARPCPSCRDTHFLPYLNRDRTENLRELKRVMPTFIDQAANDVRDPAVAIGAARFMAHEAVRLRQGKGMEFATLPGASERLYAELAR